MSVTAEWQQMMSEIQNLLVDNCAQISKYGSDMEKTELVNQMTTAMKEVCEINNSFAHQKKALHWCQNIQSEDHIDYDSEYQKKLAEIKKGKKYNVESDELFKEFKERVEDVTSNEFEVEESDMNFLDPITKQTIKQPVKSQICGHVFDKDSIDSMFRGRDPYIRCPYVGCPNKLRKKDIQEDKHLTQKFERFLNTQSQR
ncbi:hypothetical protein M8J75_004179 [Diaphorina citri]|nr:hypothetical protein M8J75_004179 [Diaphorina citri]KAI5753454.1 hypothetical protein M8J77_000315 [Diaphorina citri]